MKNYQEALVAKCYTKPGRLNRPRRCRSHAVRIAIKHWRRAEAEGFVS